MTRALPILLLAFCASVASSQGFPGGGGGMGGRGGGGGRGGSGMGRVSAPPNPTAKDVQKLDPVRLLLDKHKKLKLDKTQMAQLATLGATLREQNAPLYLRVDSLHKTFKASSGGMRASDADRSGMMENRQALFETLTAVRENNRSARNEAIALLEESQKNKAYDLLEKQLEESDRMMRGPGGMEGGPGGGRRRPSAAPAFRGA